MAIIPGSLTNQMYFQRIFAVKDISYVKMSLFISGITINFIRNMGPLCLVMGIYAMNPNLEREMAAVGFDADSRMVFSYICWINCICYYVYRCQRYTICNGQCS